MISTDAESLFFYTLGETVRYMLLLFFFDGHRQWPHRGTPHSTQVMTLPHPPVTDPLIPLYTHTGRLPILNENENENERSFVR